MNKVIQHNGSEIHPRSVSIAGEDFFLYYPITPRYRETWAFIMVDGLPTVPLYMFNGKPYLHSIERAERTIKAFRENHCKWLPLLPNAYGMFDSVGLDTPSPQGFYDKFARNFDVEDITKPGMGVEVYSTEVRYIQNNAPHAETFYTISVLEDGSTRFVIFDQDMQKEIITIHNKLAHPTKRISHATHGIPRQITGEDGE